jgi:SAM-dependent methyltransferase
MSLGDVWMLSLVKGLLGHERLYVALQKGVGADGLRYRCIEEIKPGDKVLDVGCGPAYYFDRLPDVTYVGFDTSPRYIEHARKRWGHKGEFHCEILTREHLATLPRFDKVLLFGLLHHLSDEESAELLSIAAAALADGGVVISVDPTFEPSQGRISRWMSENDRGQYVRTPERYVEMARAEFGEIEGEIWNDVTRIPSSHWMMRMSQPRAVGA